MVNAIQVGPTYRSDVAEVTAQASPPVGSTLGAERLAPSASNFTMSQIMGELMRLIRELFNIMKEGQATAETKALELQIASWEKNFKANEKNLDANNKRALADLWGAISTAALAGIGAAVGMKSSVFNGLQITGQFSPITDKATSYYFNHGAGGDTKEAEDLRTHMEILKTHGDSMQRTAGLHQEEADKQRRDFMDVYLQMQRVFLELERLPLNRVDRAALEKMLGGFIVMQKDWSDRLAGVVPSKDAGTPDGDMPRQPAPIPTDLPAGRRSPPPRFHHQG